MQFQVRHAMGHFKATTPHLALKPADLRRIPFRSAILLELHFYQQTLPLALVEFKDI